MISLDRHESKFSLIYGFPGTGKTYIKRLLVYKSFPVVDSDDVLLVFGDTKLFNGTANEEEMIKARADVLLSIENTHDYFITKKDHHFIYITNFNTDDVLAYKGFTDRYFFLRSAQDSYDVIKKRGDALSLEKLEEWYDSASAQLARLGIKPIILTDKSFISDYFRIVQ